MKNRGEEQTSERVIKLPQKSNASHSAWKIGGFVVAVVFGVFIGIGIYKKTQLDLPKYNQIVVKESRELINANKTTYMQYKGSLIRFNKNGILCMDKDGQELWAESMNLKQPMGVVRGDYIAIADLNGNQVHIFNQDGRVNIIETPYTISDIDVAKQGVVCVLLEGEGQNFIHLYDKTGQLIAERDASFKNAGHPLDVSISEDGTKMMSSQLVMENIRLANRITAHNFGEVGQNMVDRQVGFFELDEGTFVPKVQFLDNSTVCAFGDNQFIFYNFEEQPEEKCRIKDFTGEIQSIVYNNKLVGAVTLGGNAEEYTGALYTMNVYGLNGNRLFTYGIDFIYHTIYASQDEIIAVGDNHVLIYNTRGKCILDYETGEPLCHVAPTGKAGEYLFIYQNRVDRVKLENEKQTQNEKEASVDLDEIRFDKNTDKNGENTLNKPNGEAENTQGSTETGESGEAGSTEAGEPGEAGSTEAGEPAEPGSTEAGEPGEAGSTEAGEPGEAGSTEAGEPGSAAAGA